VFDLASRMVPIHRHGVRCVRLAGRLIVAAAARRGGSPPSSAAAWSGRSATARRTPTTRRLGGRALNIVHRDLNPQNVLVGTTGEVKIIDSASPRARRRRSRTAPGMMKGKFAYMSRSRRSREARQAQRHLRRRHRALRMLTGKNPFQRETLVETVGAVQRFEPPPPSVHDPAYAPFDRSSQGARQGPQPALPGCGRTLLRTPAHIALTPSRRARAKS